MEWVYIVQDDGKDGCFLAAFQDESEAAAYAEHIGPANVFKVPLLAARKLYHASVKRGADEQPGSSRGWIGRMES